ncbi:MAG: hypothetical protein A2001_01520 [Treponema sp. GWC1_61_84]|nr:MAG: hypothetical protein A2001_01520 [Treponema sp. GWC1_61_84]
MTALDLYARLAGYFGETDCEHVATAVQAELADIEPSAYDALFRGITKTRPKNFGPCDVKDIADAAAALRLAGVTVDRRDVRPCPVCGMLPLGTRVSCTTCGFDLTDWRDDAAIKAHAEWWALRKAGKAPRYDVRGEMAKLAATRAKKAMALGLDNPADESGAKVKTAANIIARMSGARK